jgi:predicted ATPase
MRRLPYGTVTFLFTDIEGSTKLLHELGPEAYAAALLQHRQILRGAFARHGGVEVDTQGDAFFVAFPTAPGAVQAAAESQEALSQGPIRVRMGLHTGDPHLTDEGYVGQDVHKGARIASAGHGGQVLLSKETRDLVDASVSDLGEHRLKDFDGPVSIFQLGAERFPPLKTISNTNLPRPASSFVGRGKEVAEVVSLLGNGARLLTLTGPGGSGKTRLSIEAAAELVPEFKAGVFWVPLAALRDPALVSETVGQTLGAKDGLAEHIGERQMLLLLDNFEQVVEAAAELPTLLEACSSLKVLVTSREVLRVRGEVEYSVPPLADPEAVELFCTRSRLEPDDAIAELCRRLDTLPLAIELAAARTTVLTPAQILERLAGRLDLLKGGRDAEARQQTLRATIEWSHDLLTEDEKRLFARLAVFWGGCTLEAAEAVTDADLDVLQSLVEKSLLRHAEDRFWMLETIREYASERLEESGEGKQLRERHADHYLALAEKAEPEVKRGRPQQWLDRLEADHDNLRAALDRLEAAGQTQLALQLAGALFPFWEVRGYLAEPRARLERLLDADEQPTAARARALNAAAGLADFVGDFAKARLRGEEAFRLNRELGDAWGAAYAGWQLGALAARDRNWKAARAVWEESLAAFRELGDDHFVLAVTRSVAWTYEELGELDRSLALHKENLHRARELGNERAEARELGTLAMFALSDGRIDVALSTLQEAFRLNLAHGFQIFVSIDLIRFGMIAAHQARPAVAAMLISRAELIREEMGATFESWVDDERDETLATIRAQLDEATFAEAWEAGRKLTVEQAIAMAFEDST